MREESAINEYTALYNGSYFSTSTKFQTSKSM